MEGSILNNLGIDPFYIILALAVLNLILLIVVFVGVLKMQQLYRGYDYFMRGKDAESLEELISEQMDEILELRSQDRANKDAIRTANKNSRAAFQKIGIVKYNAFQGDRGETEVLLGNEEKEALEQALGYKEREQ